MTPPPLLRVLVVDDDEEQLTLRCLLLRRAGFAVVSASDAPSALCLARTEKPHCAVLDLRLPTEEAGLHLIRELKRENRNLHLFILTGAPSPRLLTLPEAALVDEVFVKPASSALLIEHLRGLASALRLSS